MSYVDKNVQSYNKGAREWSVRAPLGAAHMYLEKPAMEKEMPEDCSGKSVLVIGVGSGYELGEILKRNPDRVVGIDISDELIKIASEKYPNVELFVMDMMNLTFPDGSFDFVYSSLVFHYSNDWDVLLAGVRRVMRKGGTLLFSTHNPNFWSTKSETGNVFTNKRGVTLKEHTAILPAGDIEIIFYNHPSGESIQSSILHAGFTLKSFFAPQVIELSEEGFSNLAEKDQIAYTKMKDKNLKTPLFLVVKCSLD